MNYRGHGPAHFHAIHGDFEAMLEVETRRVNGSLPRRALAHVHEWRQLHRQELLDAWSAASTSQPLPRIEPLE